MTDESLSQDSDKQPNAHSSSNFPKIKAPRQRRRFFISGVVILLVLGFVLDASRSPDKQVSAWAYIQTVRGYQSGVSPWLQGWVRCRYEPSCSQYSIDAVERYGIVQGLWLTAKRIVSCNGSVLLGTYDPVP